MTDDQLRALVRDAVARHLGREGAGPAAPFGGPGPSAVPLRLHPSHYRYALTSGGDEAGPCLIEPTVPCNHCGYCQSHGH
jgi:hypothetical protein